MITQQRRMDDPNDPWSTRRSGGPGAGTLLIATVLGVGIGLLAAPQAGTKTRKLLRKRIAALGEEAGDSLDDVRDKSSKAKRRVKQRLAKLREDAGEEWEDVGDRWESAKSRLRGLDEEDDSSSFGPVLAILAGVAATYFLTSDRTAPARSRVQVAASDVRRRATDQWDRFQRGGSRQGREGSTNAEPRPETRAGSSPSDVAPQAS